MSTNLLYHGFGIVRYDYIRTEYGYALFPTSEAGLVVGGAYGECRVYEASVAGQKFSFKKIGLTIE